MGHWPSLNNAKSRSVGKQMIGWRDEHLRFGTGRRASNAAYKSPEP
jgi:hypothetical protein